jgi:catechol 2,3-dioxygenase-like lactoylglutathione lyase family enzyme
VDESADAFAMALPSGQHLFFHRVDALSPATLGPYTGRHFAFHVTHPAFQAIVARLRAAGIPESDTTLPRTAQEAETYFYDPDGHWLQITTEDSSKASTKYPHLLRYSAS